MQLTIVWLLHRQMEDRRWWGRRFLSQTETNYAPVEGEALAVAWALEQTKFFTMGCNNLLIIVDHKPLVKIFGD